MDSNPLTFLESVAGYAQYIAKAESPSANAPIRLAVIDPSYVASTYPGTLPKVTFEGEDTLSEKRYPVLTGYYPVPSDRVVMLPAGKTYVILGSLNGHAPYARLASPSEYGKRELTGTATITIPANSSSATTTIDYSSAGYTANPRIWLTWNATTGDSAYPFFTVSVDLVFTTGCTIRGAFSTAGTLPADRTMTIDWRTLGA